MSKKPEAKAQADTPETADVKGASQTLVIYGENPYQLVFPEALPEADFLEYGNKLGKALEFAGWRLGDWVNFGLKQYGYKDYEKMAGITGLSEQALRAASSVSSRVPVEFRGEASLEKFRLMLGRRNDKETIPHLVKRLGKKTQQQLRDMARSGTSGEKAHEVTATELYEEIQKVYNLLDNFETGEKEKLSILASFERDDKEGGMIKATAGMLQMLLKQLDEEVKPDQKKA